MFCDIPHVNQLVALLQAHEIRDIVVCPGSRNATIVHDLHEAGSAFCLHPVTDERSAAFVALGMILATQRPAAVCVTSGSALLGCLPGTAEAAYRHLPLLIISADRPPEWIGQWDGQTIQQTGALAPYAPTYTLTLPQRAEDHWANNRTINEALLRLHTHGGTPVHLNVPIAEPMFSFSTPQLPQERIVKRYVPTGDNPLPPELVQLISEARLPLLLIGQYERGDLRKEVEDLESSSQLLVLPEIISDVPGSLRMPLFDAFRRNETDERVFYGEEEVTELMPDVVIQMGGNFVHKRFKQLLRRHHCRVVRIGREDGLPDTFCNLEAQVCCGERQALAQLAATLPHKRQTVMKAQCFFTRHALQPSLPDTDSESLPTMAQVMTLLHCRTDALPQSFTLHLGNSSSVRAAARVFPSGQNPVFCNRGVNGIEGSLSAAVGYALKMWGLSLLVVGDLSFFYDANALWNTQLPANLRILLLNNGHGSIFDHLPGLELSAARDTYIAAGDQNYSARGIASTFQIDYEESRTLSTLPDALHWLLADADRARLLEVHTAD